MLAWLALASCRPVAPAPLAVEVAGCAWISPGPTCHVGGPTELAWWVAGAEAPSGAGWAPSGGGFAARLRQERPGTVTIRTPSGRAAWQVVFDAATIDALDAAALDQALVGASAGQYFALAWTADRLGLPGWDAARVEQEAVARGAWWWAARAALKQAYAANARDKDPTATLAAVQRARDHRDRAGHPLGFTLDYAIDFAEGLGQLAAGNHRRADVALRAAAARAERLGQEVEAGHARRQLAQSLVRAGSAAEALALLRSEPPSADPCAESDRHNELAWALIQAREAGSVPDLDSPRPLLAQARTAVRAGPCDPRYDADEFESQAWLNQAIVEVWDGDVAAAQHALAESRRLTPALADPWLLEVEARIELLAGRPDRALAVYEQLAARAEGQVELQWMAARGAGIALTRLGRTTAAIDALQRAQTLFFRQGLLVPLQLGRAAYYAQREQSTIELAEALLARGDARAAFDALRNQRAQYLAGLHQTARLNAARADAPPAFLAALAELRAVKEEQAALRIAQVGDPADEAIARQRAAEERALEERARAALDAGNLALGLRVASERRRAGAGEVLLGWFPAREGWIGFGESPDHIEVARWPGHEPPAANELLAPFAEQIRRAARVVVLPYGPLDAVDLHAAPFGGGTLLDEAPVGIGLDLAEARPGPPPRSALVVAVDPSGRLHGAFASVEPTAQALRRLGWQVEVLTGPDATVDAVLARLPRVDWLDFSGHGTGGARWDNTLVLHDGEIGVDDILALPRVPAVAVLNACETGAREAGAVGLAQAFIAAGATAAIATAREVEDALAAEFAAELYQRIAGEAPVLEAYQGAVLALARAHPRADWSTYRLIEP